MNRKQLDDLSSALSKAINPAARKIEATAKILGQIEPLPLVSRLTHENLPSTVFQSEEIEMAPKRNLSSCVDVLPDPVENTLAKTATVARSEPSPWPMATVVKTATAANLATHDHLTTVDNLTTLDKLAEVKGELRIPNTIIDSLLPTLEPAAALLYLRLYRLSRGYRKDTCVVGLQKLATATHTSQRTVQRAIETLERRHLVVRAGANFGGRIKGIQFRVNVPADMNANLAIMDTTTTVANSATKPGHAKLTSVARMTTLANLANNKDDDLLNTNHHQSGEEPSFPQPHRAKPQEARDAREEHNTFLRSDKASDVIASGANQSARMDHLAQTTTAYTTVTQNPWLQSDTVSYLKHGIDRVPIEKLKNVIQAVSKRAESRINSFAYFVKEILTVNDPQSQVGKRKALAAIVKRVRDSHRGRNGYSTADLVCDVKAACAREAVIFDNDLFNELL